MTEAKTAKEFYDQLDMIDKDKLNHLVLSPQLNGLYKALADSFQNVKDRHKDLKDPAFFLNLVDCFISDHTGLVGVFLDRYRPGFAMMFNFVVHYHLSNESFEQIFNETMEPARKTDVYGQEDFERLELLLGEVYKAVQHLDEFVTSISKEPLRKALDNVQLSANPFNRVVRPAEA
jgi:hypothetical protein